jgi:hypothetical protein
LSLFKTFAKTFEISYLYSSFDDPPNPSLPDGLPNSPPHTHTHTHTTIFFSRVSRSSVLLGKSGVSLQAFCPCFTPVFPALCLISGFVSCFFLGLPEAWSLSTQRGQWAGCFSFPSQPLVVPRPQVYIAVLLATAILFMARFSYFYPHQCYSPHALTFTHCYSSVLLAVSCFPRVLFLGICLNRSHVRRRAAIRFACRAPCCCAVGHAKRQPLDKSNSIQLHPSLPTTPSPHPFHTHTVSHVLTLLKTIGEGKSGEGHHPPHASRKKRGKEKYTKLMHHNPLRLHASLSITFNAVTIVLLL